jgi:hypothetical protein
MKITIDRDVAKVADFMIRNVPAAKLQSVARSLSQLSDLVWAHHAVPTVKAFRPFQLEHDGPNLNAIEGPADLLERPADAM